MSNINEKDKNFKKVRFYQDKILLETELNELQDIQNRRFEDFVYDALGNCIITGLNVSANEGWNVSVNTGKAYIKGKVVTNKGIVDQLSIIDPNSYNGDLTLYVIVRPIEKIYMPDKEGDKGWEYGVGEPTTYRTEESYEVVIAQEGTSIVIGDVNYAEILPTDKDSYIEIARILRPQSAQNISDCIIRDTRPHLLNKLVQIVNKKVYQKAEQKYETINDLVSSKTLLITTGNNTKDERDRIGVDLNVTPANISAEDGSKIYDLNGEPIKVVSIETRDENGETLPEALVTLSGDVSEKVYVPIVGAANLLSALNFDFENGSSDPEKWERVGNPVYDTTGEESYSGTDAVKVSYNNSYTTDFFTSIEGNKKYIVTARLRPVDPLSLNYQFKVQWYDVSNVLIETDIKEIILEPNGYKKYVAVFTAPAEAVNIKISLNGDGVNSDKWFWVDNVELLADFSTPNLLIDNPDFESGSLNPDSWTGEGFPVYSVDEMNGYNGNAAVKVSFGNSLLSDQWIPIIGGSSYILSSWVKSVENGNFSYRLKLKWYNNSFYLISSSYVDVVVNEVYDQYYGRLTAPVGAAYAKVSLDGDDSNSTNWFWVDSVSVCQYDVSIQNLLSLNNYDFEKGYFVVENWQIVGSPLYITDGSKSYNGNDAVRVSSGNSYITESFIPVSVGLPYRISLFVKADNSEHLIYQFRINWYDNLQNFISSSTNDITVSAENYARYSVIMTAPQNAVYAKVVLNGDGINSDRFFWIDRTEIVPVTQHYQFPIVLHYGYEYTLANLPANFAMADISTGVSIDMAIQEVLGNRYFDGSLPIGVDGKNSVDSRLVELFDQLHTHQHKGVIAPRLEARDSDILNPPGITSQKTVEDHIITIGNGLPDDNNPHGLSAKNVDLNKDEIPYPNAFSDDILKAKTEIHGQQQVSIADHILEVGTGIPDSRNPHGLDSSDIEHNSETRPDGSFKTIEEALFDRIRDLSGEGVVRGLRVFAENGRYVKVTSGYAYVNGKRIRIGNSIVIVSLLSESKTQKTFRVKGPIVGDKVYISYFGDHTYYRWVTTAYEEDSILKVTINDGNMVANYDGVQIISYKNLKWDNNEKFEAQIVSQYQRLEIEPLGLTNDRIDTIILSDNGILSVAKGTEDGTRKKAVVPNNSIKLAEVYVNYNTETEVADLITYDDIGDFRFRIDWKHSGAGLGSGSIDFPSNGTTELDSLSIWKRLQILDSTVEYYKQLFVSSADLGVSLSQMAVETFANEGNQDIDNSSNVVLDDATSYLGADEIPIQSCDLIADWRKFPTTGGIGTWVSKTYIDTHTTGIDNLLANQNADFESGLVDPDSWVRIGDPIYSIDGSNSYSGMRSVKVSAGNGYELGNTIPVLSGLSYKISAYIKAESVNVLFNFKAKFYNAADVYLGTSETSVVTSNSKYDRYEGVLVAPIGATQMKIVLEGDGINSANWFWVDSVDIIQLSNIDSVLLFARYTYNGGGNKIRWYASNNGTIPTEEVRPNAIHHFSTQGSQLRVKIEIETDNNSGETQPRVHSFSLVWGIGQGHNHNGENSANTLGDDPVADNLTVIGNLQLKDNEFVVPDVCALLNYLTPPPPPVLGTEDLDNGADFNLNGPNDMRQHWDDFNFLSGNAFIPADAILLSGSSILPGRHHIGVCSLSGTEYYVYGYIYPADQGYLEVTINGQVIATLNLRDLWVDDFYTNRSQPKVNVLPRSLTRQTDYPMNGVHGNIELTERMTYVPTQTSLPFPYYQTAKYRFLFNPYLYMNSAGINGEEELGVLEMKHYTNPSKTTLIGSVASPSIYNDVG